MFGGRAARVGCAVAIAAAPIASSAHRTAIVASQVGRVNVGSIMDTLVDLSGRF